jgi:hypothetical protein
MRVLLFLTLITLILSCSEQPLMYEPQTRVQQGVPSGQIELQIDTLFSSWKAFHNDDYQYPIVQLYANQLDNGYFGIRPFQEVDVRNWLTPKNRWLDDYQSITFNFTYILTPSAVNCDFMIVFGRRSPSGGAASFFYRQWCPQSGDTVNVSWTMPVDTIQAATINNTYKDIDYVAIAFASNFLNRDVKDPYSVNTYTSYLSELLITGVRRQDVQGKGE